MLQQGQVLKLKSKGANGEALWAYRYRLAGRDSKRVQRGGGDGRERAIQLLDSSIDANVHRVDARWTSRRSPAAQAERENHTNEGEKLEARSRTRTDDPFLTMEVLYRLSYPGGRVSL
jgi:hypothetical protein